MGILSGIFGLNGQKSSLKKIKHKHDDEKAGLGNKFTIEEITKARVCELLEIHDIQGPMVSLIACRKLVCEWASRVGEKGVSERRKFMLGQIRQVQGVSVIEQEPQEA